VFVGTEWFVPRHARRGAARALWRQITFSLAVLAVEIPLGIAAGAVDAGQGWKSSAVLVIVALSLLIPWNVVGTIWQIFGRADIGLMGAAAAGAGHRLQLHRQRHARLAHGAADGCVALDAAGRAAGYAGLRSIPTPTTRPRSIDGASKLAVFRYIQLPKMRGVLMIAVLLRFMDSFMIYTEPFVLTGGGPGNATTFLSQFLTQKAVGQFDLGPAAAFSLIYFLIILLLSVLHSTQLDAARRAPRTKEGGHE
jgi:glycerol transport system permease protein